jgi:hypothetical protein
MRQLWIFRVSGGEPFELQVKGNPVMKYDGRPNSILRTLCTRAQAMALEAEIRSRDCTVEGNCPDESPAQKEKRQNIMHVLGGELTFPAVKCAECAWFDPGIPSLCGAGFSTIGDRKGWDDDAMKGVMTNEKYAADFASCPIRDDQMQ